MVLVTNTISAWHAHVMHFIRTCIIGYYCTLMFNIAIKLEEIKGNDGAADYSFWLRKLERYVHKTMPDRCTDIRVTKMAVIFQYQGEIEVDLLISPHIVDPHEFYRFLGRIPPEHHSRQVHAVCLEHTKSTEINACILLTHFPRLSRFCE